MTKCITSGSTTTENSHLKEMRRVQFLKHENANRLLPKKGPKHYDRFECETFLVSV